MMSDWMSWFLVAGVVVILELFTGTFYLLMIAIGIAAGALVALAGPGMPVQTLVAAAVGVLATLLLRRSKYGKPATSEAGRDANVNMDVGQRIDVAHWVDGEARVMYRGAQWDVQLAPGANPEAGNYIIQEVRGSRLIVG
ncbi:membrane protein implicated in regulation of membrane protease activity [Janthinobacterium sp. CG_S6]|nr:NfeD family protein [Janthinobacterium sp. CG_S6]MEC5161908.1 membrane protein implicated in regulation of membrane protease activity [Janthinobacterium sp. CG_S6]